MPRVESRLFSGLQRVAGRSEMSRIADIAWIGKIDANDPEADLCKGSVVVAVCRRDER
jgi:hypothetical protein